MSSEETEALRQIISRFEFQSHDIYVRELLNGKWNNVSLAELPGELAIQHVCRMLRQHLVQAEKDRARRDRALADLPEREKP